jgi:hypothetical protein
MFVRVTIDKVDLVPALLKPDTALPLPCNASDSFSFVAHIILMELPTERALSRILTRIFTHLRSAFVLFMIFGPMTSEIYPDSRIDISDEFSFTHMLEFSKLATAFAIELGGWKKA